jgi:uncharacterized membrane protein
VEFARLALAALAWFLLHAAVAGSGLRGVLVRRFGDKRYRGGFSFASLASLWWLTSEYRGVAFRPLWSTPRFLYALPLVLVPAACVLLVGAFLVPNPTAVGGERHLFGTDSVKGVLSVTRHPFLWAVVLWATAHLLVNPDLASLIFFCSLGVTALRGTFDIDRKRRRTHPVEFARFEAATSNVPFAALLSGRARAVPGQLWLPLLLGLGLALGAVVLHPHFLGVSAIPWLHG